ncbi:MAG: dihydropteroate synthase [Nitratireductor sp.]
MPRRWQIGHGRSLETGPRALIMGVLNVTPDSFSDGGRFDQIDKAVAQAITMLEAGADIIDIGGESTKPGAEGVDAVTEQSRVLPVIRELARIEGMVLSVDTYRASTAGLAIEAGAHIVNDVWGLQKDPEIAGVIAASGSGAVIMHTGRERQRDRDVIADQIAFLSRSLQVASAANIDPAAIILDPGFGFAKDNDENLELLASLEALHVLGYPLLTGTSRKRFIGHVTGRDGENRDIGTSATSVVARMKGSAIFRVHDVTTNRDALAIADAVLAAGRKTGAGN